MLINNAKKCSGAINICKNKLNSEIIFIFYLHFHFSYAPKRILSMLKLKILFIASGFIRNVVYI